MNRWIKIFYIIFAILFMFIAMIVTWTLAYANHYVKEMDRIVQEKDFESLLKKYEWYLDEPEFVDQEEHFEIRSYQVVGLYGGSELEVIRNSAFVFFVTDIDEGAIDISESDQLMTLKVVCEEKEKDFAVFSDVYHSFGYLSFELFTDAIKDTCSGTFDIELYDQAENLIYEKEGISYPLTVDEIISDGEKGYSILQTMSNLFPFRVITTLALVFIFYIMIFKVLWSYIKRLWLRRIQSNH